MITGLAPSNEDEIEDKSFQEKYKLAVDLYGLIHQRFVQTKEGLNKVLTKFRSKEFGTCPRYHCNLING